MIYSDEKLDRDTVLIWLKSDIQLLRKWAIQAHTIKNSMRVKCLRASIYGCSVALQALKEKQLDDLAREVEEIKQHLGLKK